MPSAKKLKICFTELEKHQQEIIFPRFAVPKKLKVAFKEKVFFKKKIGDTFPFLGQV